MFHVTCMMYTLSFVQCLNIFVSYCSVIHHFHDDLLKYFLFSSYRVPVCVQPRLLESSVTKNSRLLFPDRTSFNLSLVYMVMVYRVYVYSDHRCPLALFSRFTFDFKLEYCDWLQPSDCAREYRY